MYYHSSLVWTLIALLGFIVLALLAMVNSQRQVQNEQMKTLVTIIELIEKNHAKEGATP